jgi:hypothetical protein
MATTIRFNEAVTVGTTPVEYVIDTTRTYVDSPAIDLPITTAAGNSGTIKFQVGATPNAAQTAVAADKKILLLGVQNGLYNFWAVGSAASQVFTVG